MSMHDIRVEVLSAEAASSGVAELWARGQMIGFTVYEDGDLMLHIERGQGDAAIVVGVHGLSAALEEASRLLAPY